MFKTFVYLNLWCPSCILTKLTYYNCQQHLGQCFHYTCISRMVVQFHTSPSGHHGNHPNKYHRGYHHSQSHTGYRWSLPRESGYRDSVRDRGTADSHLDCPSLHCHSNQQHNSHKYHPLYCHCRCNGLKTNDKYLSWIITYIWLKVQNYKKKLNFRNSNFKTSSMPTNY